MSPINLPETSDEWNDVLKREEHDEFRDELLRRLRSHTALPFLFIGSGMSRRYLDLPDWDGILRHFAEKIGGDFNYYKATANGDMPEAASAIAADFHKSWFNDDRYKASRKKYQHLVQDSEAALKVALAEYIASATVLDKDKPGINSHALRLEVERLRTAVIDGVITTNYDTLAEQIFDSFEAYIGQDELLLSDAQFIGEIYKIHGSCCEPNSLVVTAKDYARFSARNVYLAAKLLTIFAEHPVVFLGYSISDQNIRDILRNIALAVGADKIETLADRIYFIEWNHTPNEEPEISRYFLEVSSPEGGFPGLPVTRIVTHSFLPLFDALSRLSRPFPAKVLRELRKHVFDLVTRPDSPHTRESVHVVPFDSDAANNLRVVFGVGEFSDEDMGKISSVGFRSISREDLAHDVLDCSEASLEAKQILNLTLPELLKNGTSYLPVWKYIRAANLSEDDIYPGTSVMNERVVGLALQAPQPPTNSRTRFERDYKASLLTPDDVMKPDLADYMKFHALLCLDPQNYSADDLKVALANQLTSRGLSSPNVRSQFFKALVHYDRLRWGPGWSD